MSSNHQQENGINVISNVENVTNIITVKSANITASATNTDAENANAATNVNPNFLIIPKF